MTNDTDTRSAPALAIANWWADHAFRGTIGDTGDRSEGAGFTMALAIVAGAQGVVAPAGKRDAFVDELARRVDEQLATRADRPHFGVTIGVDYGPDPILADAAEAVGVSRGSFPWKTVTWTYPTHVVASLGYGGKDALVWQADDWDRPVCGSGQYGPAPKYDRLPWKCSGLQYHDDDHTFDVPDPLCAASISRHGGNLETCRRPAGDQIHNLEDPYSMSHAFEGETA